MTKQQSWILFFWKKLANHHPLKYWKTVLNIDKRTSGRPLIVPKMVPLRRKAMAKQLVSLSESVMPLAQRCGCWGWAGYGSDTQP